RFLMIGGGARFGDLKQAVADAGLTNFVFRPYQLRSLLKESLSLPDVHWLSLRPEFEGLIVPSKFYGIAAAGRPMLMIGDPEGELARIVDSSRCGFPFPEGDAAGLAAKIAVLAADPDLACRLGANARQLIEASASMAASVSKWQTLLGDVVSRASPLGNNS